MLGLSVTPNPFPLPDVGGVGSAAGDRWGLACTHGPFGRLRFGCFTDKHARPRPEGTANMGVCRLAASIVLTFIVAVPAFGQAMPPEWYDNSDPHDLIGNYNYMTARNGTDLWEVWVCDPMGPSSVSSLNRFVAYTPRMVVDWLVKRSNIVHYFRWLSDGQYEVRFQVGGTVTPDMSKVGFLEYARLDNRREACADAIMSAGEDSKADGVLIVDTNRPFYGRTGMGWSGHEFCVKGECRPYPQSGRYTFVDGSAWVNIYIHEIGHAINWSHSYFLEEHSSNEHNNRMDVMSWTVGWVGTIAINRYAAGWIDPDDVAVWTLGDKGRTFRLDPVGVSGGYQMLIVRDERSTVYYTLGARVKDRYDSHIPKEGIETYMVDESASTNCGWDGWDWCPGSGRTIVAIGDEPYGTDNVAGVDETNLMALVDGGGEYVFVLLVVEGRENDSFTVRIVYS